MVNMASDMDRRLMRPQEKWCNMAAVLQLVSQARHTALHWPRFISYIFDIENPYYGQLTPIKTKYALTRITWPYRKLKPA